MGCDFYSAQDTGGSIYVKYRVELPDGTFKKYTMEVDVPPGAGVYEDHQFDGDVMER
jgi:hypothetical protein